MSDTEDRLNRSFREPAVLFLRALALCAPVTVSMMLQNLGVAMRSGGL